MRQRRRIVDAVASHGHHATLVLQSLDGVGLVAGANLGQYLGDAQFLGDGLSRGAVVTGQHHQAQPLGPQTGKRLGGRGLDRVGQVEHACGLAVDGHQHDRMALAAWCFGQGEQGRQFDTCRTQ